VDAPLAGREHGLDVVVRPRPRRAHSHRFAGIVAALLLGGAVASGCAGEGGDTVDFVQLPDSRLIKVQSVGLAAFGRINPNTATASLATQAFGEPSAVEPRSDACRRIWSDLGLKVDFALPADADPCAGEALIERLVVAGRAAAKAGWRTAEGIRPLQTVATVRRIYPEAGRVRSRRLVLVKPPGGGGGDAPVLVVTIADGRVDAMVFPVDAVAR
jgi:hypothetical protein